MDDPENKEELDHQDPLALLATLATPVHLDHPDNSNLDPHPLLDLPESPDDLDNPETEDGPDLLATTDRPAAAATVVPPEPPADLATPVNQDSPENQALLEPREAATTVLHPDWPVDTKSNQVPRICQVLMLLICLHVCKR